ncbi:uncharacterized protein Bfra_004261 [Botrytis fragariae]|uniref:Uncharacterized protein n=1 Tax=Botrytis fragariae TaxID=1964551 RepID=A0A8H6AV57_9HELO|nr:uncharacterized protein Bfra_004261 [Botrytis fragariae]KAF5874254.1 hypothetical protein Bfra_004261 [Botrytis fragariae]
MNRQPFKQKLCPGIEKPTSTLLGMYSFEMYTDLSQKNRFSASKFPQTLVSFNFPRIRTTSQRRVLVTWLGKERITTHTLIENTTAFGNLIAWPDFSNLTHCSTQVETAHSSHLSTSLVRVLGFILLLPITESQSLRSARTSRRNVA